jgi:hypothetical protein
MGRSREKESIRIERVQDFNSSAKKEEKEGFIFTEI